MAVVTIEQIRALHRAVGLIGRFGDVLAPFERETVDEAIDRLRRRGDRTVLTDSEWTVVQEAIGGMDAAQADALIADEGLTPKAPV